MTGRNPARLPGARPCPPSRPDPNDPLAHRDYGLKTRRQLKYCLAFIGEAQGRPTLAARIAGYPFPNRQGPRLLSNIGVPAAIARLRDELAMPEAEILFWLNEVARADLSTATSATRRRETCGCQPPS